MGGAQYGVASNKTTVLVWLCRRGLFAVFLKLPFCHNVTQWTAPFLRNSCFPVIRDVCDDQKFCQLYAIQVTRSVSQHYKIQDSNNDGVEEKPSGLDNVDRTAFFCLSESITIGNNLKLYKHSLVAFSSNFELGKLENSRNSPIFPWQFSDPILGWLKFFQR